jgi:hypothetical protein
MWLRATLLLALLALSACGSGGGRNWGDSYAAPSGRVPIECAPFARALTGVRLSGDAADWWSQADGRYARAHTPEVGSVLVLRRSSRLPDGHVSVVTRVISSREVLVTQANWVRRRITMDQPVVDVSAENDWSAVRVYWPPSGQMGTGTYSAFGFIIPDRPPTHDQIAAATPAAARAAVR